MLLLLLVPYTWCILVNVQGPTFLSGFYIPQPGKTFENTHGRPSFRHVDQDDLWLFSFKGKWLIGDQPGVDAAVAYIESWAQMPCDISTVSPNTDWSIQVDKKGWIHELDFVVTCEDGIALSTAEGKKTIKECESDEYLQRWTILANHVVMPRVGLGTAGVNNDYEMITWGIEAGYRLVDTASRHHPAYANEHILGNAIDEQQARHRIFVTTKLSPAAHGYQSTLNAIDNALLNLRTDYIDLFLIHHPSCLMNPKGCEGTWHESWRAMERAFAEGTVRAIGVSNFDIQLLKELIHFANAPIALVQNWHDPFHQDNAVIEYCHKENIVYQSFSTLGRQYIAQYVDGVLQNVGSNPVLTEPTIIEIAKKHNKSSASVVLRWALQQGLAIIPQSSKYEHIVENHNIFDFQLDITDMQKINSLNGKIKR